LVGVEQRAKKPAITSESVELVIHLFVTDTIISRLNGFMAETWWIVIKTYLCLRWYIL